MDPLVFVPAIITGLVSGGIGFAGATMARGDGAGVAGGDDLHPEVRFITSRSAMFATLRAMMESASGGSLVWGQAVGMSGYPDIIYKLAAEASLRGVSFQLILNSSALNAERIASLFSNPNSTDCRFATDCDLRILGLDEKAAVIAFKGPTGQYAALHCENSAMVRAMKFWFDARFANLPAA
jgi:hypothetical protein